MKSAQSKAGHRGYGQYCALAKALDVIGDRWTLLIVRELLARGPSRYTDIRNGLPGIATNLLVERLTGLEAAGSFPCGLADEDGLPVGLQLLAPARQDARLYRVGAVLESLLEAKWGGPLLANADPSDAVCSQWLALPIELHLRDRTPTRPPIRIELRMGGEPLVIETVDGTVRARLGRAEEPDGVITGPPRVVLALLMGKLTLANARRDGVRYQGASSALRRLVVTPVGGLMPARRVSPAVPVTGTRRARRPIASR